MYLSSDTTQPQNSPVEEFEVVEIDADKEKVILRTLGEDLVNRPRGVMKYSLDKFPLRTF